MANVCIDEANRRNRDREKTDRFGAQPSSRLNAPSVEDELGFGSENSALEEALSDLPDPYREALELRFVDDLEYKQVAEKVGVSEQNARARVSRARTAMRASLRGVAAIPVVFYGLVKRGEKAAAAATSTVGAVSASAGSTAISQASPAVSTLTEASIAVGQTAPAAVPVIAKAAVSIGLAAAVLTPTSDSAVHNTVEKIATGAAGVVLSDTPSDEIGEPLVLGSEGSAATEGSSIETVSPASDSVVNSGSDSLNEAGLVTQQGQETEQVKGSAGTLNGNELAISEAGRGQYNLSGNLTLLVGELELLGSLTSASRLRIEPSADADSRRRLDAILISELENGQVTELRLVGFAQPDSDSLQIAGLYKSVSPGTDLANQGHFSGSIRFGSGSLFSRVSITLTP